VVGGGKDRAGRGGGGIRGSRERHGFRGVSGEGRCGVCRHLDDDALDLPGNRAISFSHKIAYGLYRVTQAPENNWAKVGASYILADKLAEELFKSAKVEALNASRTSPT